jgi:hypothetical protein
VIVAYQSEGKTAQDGVSFESVNPVRQLCGSREMLCSTALLACSCAKGWSIVSSGFCRQRDQFPIAVTSPRGNRCKIRFSARSAISRSGIAPATATAVTARGWRVSDFVRTVSTTARIAGKHATFTLQTLLLADCTRLAFHLEGPPRTPCSTQWHAFV